MSPEMQADYAKWCARKSERDAKDPDKLFAETISSLKATFSQLPETVTIPYELTPEGERLRRFKEYCEPEFLHKIDRNQLANHTAFDRVASWDGSFPGPLAFGPTGTAKTRAAWSAMGRLFVKEGKNYAWFPVKRLLTEFARYEAKDLADEFWRQYSPGFFRVLMVDDADKINWQFESEMSALFQFYDWVYRSRICCITTTNKNRQWWADHAGDAFVRRFFDEAHFAVAF